MSARPDVRMSACAVVHMYGHTDVQSSACPHVQSTRLLAEHDCLRNFLQNASASGFFAAENRTRKFRKSKTRHEKSTRTIPTAPPAGKFFEKQKPGTKMSGCLLFSSAHHSVTLAGGFVSPIPFAFRFHHSDVACSDHCST